MTIDLPVATMGGATTTRPDTASVARRGRGLRPKVDDRKMLSDDVWRYLPLGPLPTLIVGMAGLGLVLAVALRSTPRSRRLSRFLLIATTLAILGITLSGGDTSLGRSVNLQPGAGIRDEFNNINHALGVINVLGNVVLFVPLGLLSAVHVLYEPSKAAALGLRRGVLAGLAMSVAVETLQYLLGRSTDVDDLLLNTSGALAGATIGIVLTARRRRRSTSRATARKSSRVTP